MTQAKNGPPEAEQTLRLIALDGEDLAVLSAHLQDSVLRVGDMLYFAKEKRFVLALNRFDWLTAGAAPRKGRGPPCISRPCAGSRCTGSAKTGQTTS